MAEAPRMRATRKTYLECPYAEKDACKAEGGRFDGERRKWYVPVGAELGNFSRWMPATRHPTTSAPTTEHNPTAPKRAASAHGSPPAAKKQLRFDGTAVASGAAAAPARRCPVHDCDLVLRKVRKDGPNQGRSFYCCPTETDACKQHGTWQWADAQPPGAPQGGGSASPVARPLHAPRRSHVQNLRDSQRAMAAVAKETAPADWICGVHGCHLSKGPFTTKRGEEHNIGRNFFLCPRKSPEDDCGLRGGFRWADGAKPFSPEQCRRAERHHGLAHGSVGVGIVGLDGQPLPCGTAAD
eukprot:COSAG06_NODE_5033_length_3775_cov_1.484222_2_plen_297_part_00